MLLAIDIGNSNVTLGFYHQKEWKHIWRLPTRNDQEARMYYQMQLSNRLLEASIPPQNIKKLILSSVVPDLTATFEQIAQHLLDQTALTLRPDRFHKLQLQIDHPEEIGTDLLANAAGAYYLYRSDCIIVDFGTALSFTIVTAKGHVLGVSIVPGLKTAINALFQKTAQLPQVPLEVPASAVGKNTVHSIQSGVLIGYVGLVRHMLQAIRAELGQHYQAVATGGLSSILSPLRNDFSQINPNLTLDGLRFIIDHIDG